MAYVEDKPVKARFCKTPMNGNGVVQTGGGFHLSGPLPSPAERSSRKPKRVEIFMRHNATHVFFRAAEMPGATVWRR